MAKQLSNGTGVKIGQATTETVGFYGSTGIARSASTFATSAVGTASSADVTTANQAALIAVMNTLSGLGIWPAQA